MTSSATGEPSGRLATPKTRREATVISPKTSRSSSEAASATLECSVKSGVAAMYTPSLTTRLTRLSELLPWDSRSPRSRALRSATPRPPGNSSPRGGRTPVPALTGPTQRKCHAGESALAHRVVVVAPRRTGGSDGGRLETLRRSEGSTTATRLALICPGDIEAFHPLVRTAPPGPPHSALARQGGLIG
jgi:hypothetical protein